MGDVPVVVDTADKSAFISNMTTVGHSLNSAFCNAAIAAAVGSPTCAIGSAARRLSAERRQLATSTVTVKYELTYATNTITTAQLATSKTQLGNMGTALKNAIVAAVPGVTIGSVTPAAPTDDNTTGAGTSSFAYGLGYSLLAVVASVFMM
jgi:hypothetical protein